MTAGPTYRCFACRAVFNLAPKPQSRTAVTTCNARYADGRQCGQRYWHEKLEGTNKVRQGIDPAWLENTTGGCRAARDPADVDKTSVG